MILEPKITIGDVPIIGQGFSWSLKPGTTPFMTNVMIPKGMYDEQLRAVENPTNIHVEVYGGVKTKYEKQEFTINNVYLIQPRELTPINVQWQIADMRFAWRGQKMFCSYNKTREKNDKIRAIGDAPETDPYKIREAIDRYRSGRYLPWSVKEDGSPYTMLEIITLELKKLSISVSALAESMISLDEEDLIKENKSYIVENVEMDGVDIYSGLQNLLSRSRLGLTVTLQGNIEVYSVDFFDDNPHDLINYLSNLLPVAPNRLYRQDLVRTRPRKVKVHFEKKIETKLVDTTSQYIDSPNVPLPIDTNSPSITQENIDERQAIGCENVLPVPYPYTDNGGKLWNIGEYVPMWKYLQDQGLTKLLVNKLYFSDQLAIYFIKDKVDKFELNRMQLSFHICNTIKQHYRQTYQIDPYYMDRIKKWEARRVGIIDNYSRFSPPAPLWADYCVAPNARIPSVAKKLALWSPNKYYNWFVNDRDPNREKPTVGSYSIVNHNLGIFRVNYPSDYTRNLKTIIPSALDTAYMPGVKAQKLNNQITDMRLQNNHTMEALCSIVWLTNKKDSFQSRDYKAYGVSPFYTKYSTVTLDYFMAGKTGKGPEIEYLSKLDYARFIYPPIVNGSQEKQVDCVNIGNIEAMAQAEGAKIINRFKDRIGGSVTYAGAVTGQIKIIGTISAITYSFTPGRGLETRLTLADHVPDPQKEQVLPQNVISFLHHQVTRSGEQNELH